MDAEYVRVRDRTHRCEQRRNRFANLSVVGKVNRLYMYRTDGWRTFWDWARPSPGAGGLVGPLRVKWHT